MADAKSQQSFQDFISEGRKKRKAEELAKEIFTKNRRTGTPPVGKNSSLGGSLASRVGVNKRSSPALSANASAFAARINKPSPASKPVARRAVTSTTRSTQASTLAQPQPQRPAVFRNGTAPELSIRGAAGPYTVFAQNFMPGTTAADIEAVMSATGGEILSCRLVASNPTVIAEMVFTDKGGAEEVIAKYNNKKADGRLLHLYMKEGGSTSRVSKAIAPSAPVAPIEPVVQNEVIDVDAMAVEGDEYEVTRRAESDAKEAARRDERSRHESARSAREDRGYRPDYVVDTRGAPPAYQDGRYGFNNPPGGPRYGGRQDRRGGYHDGGRMYSDSMYGRGQQHYRS